ncbi:MAG: hypothetical protein M1576_00590 [Deltaproteobacteria bacterium]|nr:hypothetical protein [Deltaproteobacteria bacterium]MCL5673244.1 hypothetical protein [Deltaproteobacteria bacterium]
MKKQTVKCNASNNHVAGNKKELTEKEQIKYLLEVAEANKKAGRTAVKGERAKLKALGILED